jgi:hypothetical protein
MLFRRKKLSIKYKNLLENKTFDTVKVLSSEIDLAESVAISWILIKGRAAETYNEFCSPPLCDRPLRF